MRNKSFRFKQFEVFHDKTAMKVGTDGVLLGAWIDVESSQTILDVGTGTGLIALMAAQRNESATITGIEIDKDAAIQADENVRLSKFSDRVKIENSSFQYYINNCQERFDLIVSNPPYFTASMQSPDDARTNARHDDSLSIIELLSQSDTLLTQKGMLSFIYPYEDIDKLVSNIDLYGWHVKRRTDVYSTTNSLSPKRVLFELSRTVSEEKPIYQTLFIEKERHIYTDDYVRLTKDFYLRM